MKKRNVKLIGFLLFLFCMGQMVFALCGDVNGSGNVSIVDALMIAQYVVGSGSQVDLSVADVNGDSRVTIVDALQIAQFSVGVNVIMACPAQPTPTVPPVIKIMPLGDSITEGVTVDGAYRIKLWSLMQNLGANVDFVGSQRNGPSSLGDKDHEGHSGWRIDQIDTNINTWMDTYQPYIVLLHIGTNDMIGNLSQAPARLSALLDKICAKLPSGGKLYVSTLIPLSFNDSAVRNYNAQIPGIVNSKANAGLPVYLVEMYSAVGLNDLADGVHPNQVGYDKMADVWFEAIKNDLR